MGALVKNIIVGIVLGILAANTLLADIVSESDPVDNNWYWSHWFGYFRLDGINPDGSKYLYHHEHAYLWYIPGDELFYGDGLGWFQAKEEYQNDDSVVSVYVFPATGVPISGWVSYIRGSAPERYFWSGISWHLFPVTLSYTAEGPNGPVPLWWWERGLINFGRKVNNKSIVTIGQLKHVVIQAKRYFEEKLNHVGGVGNEIIFMMSNYYNAHSDTPVVNMSINNYALANQGQLKAIANLFYERLKWFGYDTRENLRMLGEPNWLHNYPWTPNNTDDKNYNPLLIGQVKWVFSFDLSDFNINNNDSNNNGLPDWWEAISSASNISDPDKDLFLNYVEYLHQDHNNTYTNYKKLSTRVVPVTNSNCTDVLVLVTSKNETINICKTSNYEIY